MLRKKTYFLLFWSIFFCALTIFWIFKNTLPPAWDQSYYLEGSEHLYQTLRSDGLWSFLEETTKVLGRKAPLLPISTVPLYLIFGSSHQIAILINVLFFIIFVYFYYLLAKNFVGEKIAVGAVLVTSTMPLFYGLVRNYFVEFSLMSLVVLWMYLLSKTEGLTRKNYLFWLGLVSGLGMLAKFHFFLFVVGPLGSVLYERLKKSGFNKAVGILLKRSLYFIIPAALVALPWYLRNIKTVLWHAKRATDPQLLGDYYYGPFYSLENISKFLSDLVNFSISGYWFLVLLFLTVILIVRKAKIHVNWFLTLWFLVPFGVFSLGPNKDYRLLLPLLPAFGLFLSWLMYKTLGNIGNPYLGIIFILPILIFINSTFLRIPSLDNLHLGPILISGEKIGDYVAPPRNQYWPTADILNYLDSLDPHNRRKVIISASEHESFNINNLRYYVKKERLDLEIKTVSYFSDDTKLDTILTLIEGGDYLIMKIGGSPNPVGLNKFNTRVQKVILEDPDWENVANDFVFPDGGRLFVAKNK